VKFPRGIPKHMPTILGDVPVRLVKKLKDKKGTPLMGHWKMKDREICLCDGINSAAMRQALWHEWLHAVLIDAGAQPTDNNQAEAVCDSIGSALAGLFT
jgi:hypothetical protein